MYLSSDAATCTIYSSSPTRMFMRVRTKGKREGGSYGCGESEIEMGMNGRSPVTGQAIGGVVSRGVDFSFVDTSGVEWIRDLENTATAAKVVNNQVNQGRTAA